MTAKRDSAGGKREQNKKANRAAILAAALKVFWEHGYDGVTIRDVIRATHLASGTFYNYFPDKKSLFSAVMEERIGYLTHRLSRARRSAGDMRAFLFDAYLTVFEEIEAHPDFYQMMFRNEPVVRTIFSDNLFGVSMRTLKSDLRDAIARGLLPELDVDFLTAALFGAGFEMARTMSYRKGRQPSAAAEFAASLFLGGVAALGKTEMVRRGSITHEGSAR
jgi:AcrR family transcriptional regulator